MRVLIVEDSTTDLRIIERFLKQGGGEIAFSSASTLREALELARDAFDVILLDMHLPDAEGMDAVRRMRQAAPRAPIVILSGMEDEQVASAAVQAGAQDYLIKGHVDHVALRRSLRYAIERQQLADRLAASEASLQQENGILLRLTEAASRLFATLDARSVAAILSSEAQRIWGGQIALYAPRTNGTLRCVQSSVDRPPPDELLKRAARAGAVARSDDGLRLALPIRGSNDRSAWILELLPDRVLREADVFALDLLRRYAETAIQNIALFAELQAQRASVIRLNQLKDDLIAVLAHDFKGPLTTIVGFTELLEQNAFESPEETQDALKTIRGAAMRLAGLANDTLSLSRVEQGELNIANDPVDLVDLLHETLNALPAGRTINLDVDAQHAVVRGDPARLRQVFENVIGNALKYSSAEAPVAVSVRQTNQTIRIAVEDRGIGIPADEMRLLFERFRRASNAKRSSVKGTGLGLYLAKTLVERHGGNILVQSALDKGSTFTIVLPRMRDGVGGVLRVLLVTADENLGLYLLHELRSRGFASRRDTSLAAALERLAVETAEVAIVDLATIQADITPLFAYARERTPSLALLRIGGEPSGAEDDPWDAALPNPFLESELQAALERVARGRRSSIAEP